MSTDLYRIRVLALDPEQRKINFRVFLVYYDWSGVPTDASFFLRILWDEADTRFGGGGPLGDEITVQQICSEVFVDENTHRYVERVTKLSRRNDPLPPGESPPTFIYDGYKDEDRLTQGDYEVVVTDARWMAHLKVDQVWQTTSYATRAKMPAGRETLLLDVAEAPAGGVRSGVRGNRSGARTAAKKAAAKKAAAAKPAANTASAKKPAANTASAKKPAANTASAKKTAAKTASAKKPAAKTASAKKTAAKTASAKKTAANTASAKKTAAKTASAKKAPAKKVAKKKAAAKKAPAKKKAAKRA